MKSTHFSRSLVILAITSALMIGFSACARETNIQPQDTTAASGEPTTASTSTSPVDSSGASPNQPQPPTIGGFALNQAPEELLATLQQRNIPLTDNAINDPQAVPASPVNDGRKYVLLADGEVGYIFTANSLSFTFYSSDKLVIIVADSSEYPTDMGLKVGDTMAQMKQLYGTNYTFYDSNEYVSSVAYEYQLDSGDYLTVYGENHSNSGDHDDTVITSMSLSAWMGNED